MREDLFVVPEFRGGIGLLVAGMSRKSEVESASREVDRVDADVVAGEG